jgi:hypothetical protein
VDLRANPQVICKRKEVSHDQSILPAFFGLGWFNNEEVEPEVEPEVVDEMFSDVNDVA